MTATAALAATGADRPALADLVARLYALLDEGRHDELGSVYAADIDLETPSGRMVGLDAVIAGARRHSARFRRMQHLNTDLLIDVHGDRATIRANHLAVHVTGESDPADALTAGLVHRFEARRTPDGWRIVRGRAEVVWRRER